MFTFTRKFAFQAYLSWAPKLMCPTVYRCPNDLKYPLATCNIVGENQSECSEKWLCANITQKLQIDFITTKSMYF